MNAVIILITIALTLPIWWSTGLLALALLGDVSAWWRPRVSRLFARLECMGRVPPESTAPSPGPGA
jgi:hypothetical protein